MTVKAAPIKKYSGSKAHLERMAMRDAKITTQDLFNTYVFSSDNEFKKMVERHMDALLETYRTDLDRTKCLHIWTDGSYNAKDKKAGIGIVIMTDQSKEIGMYPNIAFGKSVNADSSVKAEIYAIAIGISYLLDTYPDVKKVRLHYDCLNATSCVTVADSCGILGAPYTNLKSAMKRARKQGLSISFEHVKAHRQSRSNEMADLIARYYAKAQLDKRQKTKIQKFIRPPVRVRTQNK